MIIQTNLILNIMLKINEKRSQTYCLKNVVTFHYLCVDSVSCHSVEEQMPQYVVQNLDCWVV